MRAPVRSMSPQRQMHQPAEGENTEDGECEDKDATGEQHGALASGTTLPPLRTSASGLLFGGPTGAVRVTGALQAGQMSSLPSSILTPVIGRCDDEADMGNVFLVPLTDFRTGRSEVG